jgi:hypothetical protein
MGGALVAANKIADINEEMAANSLEMKRRNTLYNIDQAYWQVVSLRHKQTLAESYVELVKKLKGDVQKMIDQGVATKGDGLSGGYGYNFVFGRHSQWLFHLSALPSAVLYKHNKLTVNGEEMRDNRLCFNMIFNERAALVYHFTPRFNAGASH